MRNLNTWSAHAPSFDACGVLHMLKMCAQPCGVLLCVSCGAAARQPHEQTIVIPYGKLCVVYPKCPLSLQSVVRVRRINCPSSYQFIQPQMPRMGCHHQCISTPQYMLNMPSLGAIAKTEQKQLPHTSLNPLSSNSVIQEGGEP